MKKKREIISENIKLLKKRFVHRLIIMSTSSLLPCPLKKKEKKTKQ